MTIGDEMGKEKHNECVICGDWLDADENAGLTNDASPVKEGTCCSYCNLHVVAPKRYSMARPGNKEHGEEVFQVSLHTKRDFIDREDYLRSLPKDEDGQPIVDEEDFQNNCTMFWEEEFLAEVMGISAYDYDEFYMLNL